MRWSTSCMWGVFPKLCQNAWKLLEKNTLLDSMGKLKVRSRGRSPRSGSRQICFREGIRVKFHENGRSSFGRSFTSALPLSNLLPVFDTQELPQWIGWFGICIHLKIFLDLGFRWICDSIVAPTFWNRQCDRRPTIRPCPAFNCLPCGNDADKWHWIKNSPSYHR